MEMQEIRFRTGEIGREEGNDFDSDFDFDPDEPTFQRSGGGSHIPQPRSL
jgi:hypothetical protein